MQTMLTCMLLLQQTMYFQSCCANQSAEHDHTGWHRCSHVAFIGIVKDECHSHVMFMHGSYPIWVLCVCKPLITERLSFLLQFSSMQGHRAWCNYLIQRSYGPLGEGKADHLLVLAGG